MHSEAGRYSGFGEAGLAEVQAKEIRSGHSVIGPEDMNKTGNKRQNRDSGEIIAMEPEEFKNRRNEKEPRKQQG